MKIHITSGLRVLCVLAFLLMVVSSAVAQAYEPFNYRAGAAPGNGDTGWAGPWTANGTVVVAPGLTFTGLTTSGNALGGTIGGAATRLLQTPVVGARGTSVVLEALIKSPVNGTPATQATLGNSPGGPGKNFIIGDLPQPDVNADKWGLQNDCGRYYSNKLVVAGQTAYLVARIDFDVSGTNDQMRLWVQTGVAVPYYTLTPDVDVMCNVNTFGGVFWQTQQNQAVDEIRVDAGRAVRGGSSQQEIERRKVYNDVQGFVRDLRSNKKAFNNFRSQVEQFHAGVREGGDVQKLGTDLVNSNEKLRRIHQQHGENNPQAFIVEVIIIIILILIPIVAS